jgi:tetratricopeptide (TPR) repeat protein
MTHLPAFIAVLATGAMLSAQVLAQGPADPPTSSEEQCLSAPDRDCLAGKVIPAAMAQDSPGIRLQEIAEALLSRGERDYAEQVLWAALGIGFDGFGTTTGLGANSDLWTVSRISRFLQLLDENDFVDLQLGTIDLLEDFLVHDRESVAREDALYLVFTTQLDLEAFDDALSTADRMASRWERHGDVAVANVEAGRTDEALALAEAIGSSTFRIKAMARIAVALAERGQIGVALEVVPDEASDIEVTNAHKAIVSALVANGQADDAIAYTNALTGPFLRSYVQDSTSEALARAGEIEAAMAMAESILVHQERAQAMATVGEILLASGEAELARDLLARFPRTGFWEDPTTESIDEARSRLEHAIVSAASR